MALGLTPTRDARRRRVLTEELLSVGSTPAGQAASAAIRRDTTAGLQADSRYTPAAAYDRQSRMTDIIPRWLVTIALLWLTGVALTAGLVALHFRQADLAVLVGQTQLPALDLAGLRGAACGSLAVWFASALLAMAMVMSLLVYSVRQHRIDDYQGRYRVWLWAALVWLLLSINCTTQLHRVVVAALSYWAGWSALEGGAVWWLVPVALLAATVGVRLLADMRECGTAVVVLITAYGCWTAAVLVHLGLLVVGDPSHTTVVIGVAVLGGHVSLLTAQVLYARHVVLDAEGQRAPRRKQRLRSGQTTPLSICRQRDVQTAPTKPVTKARGADRQRQPATGNQAAARPVPAVATTSAAATERRDGPAASEVHQRGSNVTEWTDGGHADDPDDGRDDDHFQPGKRRLSKAERKRFRKLKQKERQRHAA